MNEEIMSRDSLDAELRKQMFSTEEVVETIPSTINVEEVKTNIENPVEESVKKDSESHTKEERDFKKLYYSETSKLRKQIEELSKGKEEVVSKFSQESVETLERIVDAKVQSAKIQEYEVAEKNAFISTYPELKNELDNIESIRDSFPNMSYTAARSLYLATTNPAALVQKSVQAPTI
jgi:nucleotidyltransferase/DNA polymerase involved in DNA repair